MSEIDEIRAIVAVINTGSFTNAARRLDTTKSVVSRRIRDLEESLGTVLLNRTTRGVTATEAGEEFYERASRILSELDQAREAAAHQRGKIAGSLRLSAPFTFGVKYVAPVLAELGRDNPNLEIDATYTERRVDLLAEKFDAVIRIGNLEDSSMVSRRISTIQIGAVASPSYLARKGLPSTPEELGNHDCLIYTGSSGRPAWRFINGSNVHTVHPIGRFRADSGAALVAAAEQGVGITVLPHFMLDDAIVSGRLVPLLTKYSLPEQGLFVLRPAGGFVTPKLRAFIDIMCRHFEGEPSWETRIREAAQRPALPFDEQ